MPESEMAQSKASQPELSQVLESVRNAQRIISELEIRRSFKPHCDQTLKGIAEKKRLETLAEIDRNITESLLKLYDLTYHQNGILPERLIQVEELSAFIEKVSDIKEKIQCSVDD